MSEVKIIGRGLSGATLSFEMMQRGIAHTIYDNPQLSSSSKVAGGLINPIVLKRLKLVNDAELFMTRLPDFYKNLEKKSGLNFYSPSIIEHIYSSIGEQNKWEEKRDQSSYAYFLKESKESPYPFVKAPYGIGVMANAAWLNTKVYLEAHTRLCQQNSIPIISKTLSLGEVHQLVKNGSDVILCTGHLMKDWRFLPDEAFTPTRGEVITIKTKHLPQNSILHSSVFTLPLGSSLFKVGATYHWDILEDKPTSEGLMKLKSSLDKIYTAPYEIIAHEAGVRPNVKDRKPLIGIIKNGLYSFNGMGSRAALMAPYLAHTFTSYLLGEGTLPPAYNIQRFY